MMALTPANRIALELQYQMGVRLTTAVVTAHHWQAFDKAPSIPVQNSTQETPMPRPKSQPTAAIDNPELMQQLMAITDRAALAQLIETYKPADYVGCRQMVLSDGQPTASIMFVGEAPGEEEDIQGKPFVGKSGQLLDAALSSIGLSRQHNIYISNIVNFRPPNNRTPTDAEMLRFRPLILRHIGLIQPKIVVMVGNTPCKTLLQTTEPISKVRGQFFPLKHPLIGDQPIMTMPTFHPAYLLRVPGLKAVLWQDLLALKNYLASSSQ